MGDALLRDLVRYDKDESEEKVDECIYRIKICDFPNSIGKACHLCLLAQIADEIHQLCSVYADSKHDVLESYIRKKEYESGECKF